jgi:hypothetical protein
MHFEDARVRSALVDLADLREQSERLLTEPSPGRAREKIRLRERRRSERASRRSGEDGRPPTDQRTPRLAIGIARPVDEPDRNVDAD